MVHRFDGAGKGGDLSTDTKLCRGSSRAAGNWLTATACGCAGVTGNWCAKALLAQRWRQHPRRRKEARRGVCGGAHHRWLVRELTRKPREVVAAQAENFSLHRRVLAQKPCAPARSSLLHEPHIYCIAKARSI